jgi:glutamyl-tRNA reductase
MVLGETQILGQAKQAFQMACDCQTSNGIINTMFQQAITVGKRVRTETGIDRMAVSISYAAVELARQIFGDLGGKTVLILGAGKMSELTVKHLVSNGVDTVLVSNRSHDRAVELAELFGGKAIMFDQLYRHMERADIVISCTAASHYVIHPSPMAEVMEKRGDRKVFLIDIAVPRDIDPKVGEIPGISLFDIDDLQNVVDRNLNERREAAVLAEQIVEEEINEFLKWLNSLFVVPTIIALKEKGESIKEKELERVLRKLPGLSEKERKIVGSLANSIINQMLHDPIVQIRHYAATHQGHLYSEVLQNLFCLEVQGQRPKTHEGEGAVVDNQ